MSDTIEVDVWSDVACPWCFIGKRRLEEGVRRYSASDGALAVRVTYHSFELSPDTPVDFEGTEADFLARHKGLPLEQVHQMLEHVTRLAAAEGLAYDFDRVQHTNTRRVHEVLHLAKERGRQLAVVERLFRAYFEEGRHLGRDDVLADLGAQAGLDRQEVLDALADGRYAPAVEADVAQARASGIQGVPFYVVDGRYGVSGAQDPELFARALEQVTSERTAARP